MDQQFVNDLDCFSGAFSEFICIASEQVKDQPVLQFDCISVVLQSQLQSLVDRAHSLHLAARSERSDQRAPVEIVK